MSVGTKLLKAAAGNAGEAVYVDDVFSTFLYRGRDGASGLRTIDNGIDLAGEGGLIWTRERNNAAEHLLIDTERGLSGGNLATDRTNAANTGRVDSSIDSFTSTGYKLDGGGSLWDRGTYEYVSWTFRKQEKFFDVVTYTGNATNGRAIAHNLGSTPGMIIVKRTDSSSSLGWAVFHRSSNNLMLNSNGAANANFNGDISSVTDSSFTVSSYTDVNASSGTFVAYLFAHDEQDFGEDSDEAIIKCGSFVPSSTWQSVIDIGFEPQWLMYKNADGNSDWIIVDAMRGVASGGADPTLYANKSDAEVTYLTSIDFHPNGFEQTFSSVDTDEHIYVAIRRPHKPASEFAATDLFKVSAGNNTDPTFNSGFVTDFNFYRDVTGGSDFYASTRLTGNKYLATNSKVVESSSSSFTWDFMNGFRDGTLNTDFYSWMWRRTPGFFDVVTYKGTGGAVWHNHNLGVVPEMIICKGRDVAEYWNVFTADGGTSSRLHLDEGSEYITNNASQFFPSLPTATQFRIGQNNEIGGSGNSYIAYLFASVDGISKLGTYTGTGSAQDIDCGFSAGARFVLIKRVDVAGYWILFDSERGIVAGNDPYLYLNTSAAQVTNTDYIDPLNAGFTITSSAPANNADNSMNKSGGTYFFYAIA